MVSAAYLDAPTPRAIAMAWRASFRSSGASFFCLKMRAIGCRQYGVVGAVFQQFILRINGSDGSGGSFGAGLNDAFHHYVSLGCVTAKYGSAVTIRPNA